LSTAALTLFPATGAVPAHAVAPRGAEADAGDSAGFSVADFLEIPILTAPAVSPDGRLVAYVWTRRDIAADGRQTQLWLGDVATGATRQLTFGDESVGGLDWRPDGALSFLRTVDGEPQVWLNPLDGSEPRPVTDLAGGVSGYWWSPDGTRLALLAPAADDGYEEAEEAEDTEEGEDADEAAGDELSDWTVFDRLEQPDEYHQLWVAAVTGAGPDTACAARQLTEPPLHPYHVAWSPDGKTLAVTYNARFSSLVDEDQQVALIDVATGAATDATPDDRHSSYAAFSPDGAHLAYFTDRGSDLRAYQNLKDVVVRELASGRTELLTAGTQMGLGSTHAIPEEAPVWSADGSALYLLGADGTTFDLYRLDRGTRQLSRVTQLDGNVSGWDLAGGTLAYIESALHTPGTLYARPIAAGPAQRIASLDDAVAPWDLQPPQKLVLPGADGGRVEGYLFLPPGADNGDRLPAIIEMHGGPYYRYGNAWTTRYPWQLLSHEGFAVFIANPRGGTGYGEEFLRGVYRNFGTDDYRDLMAAVDELVAQGTIDPDRLGFTGYSYGGLMTNVVISRTDRFKAAVSIAGIFNYVSAMGQNNPQLFIDSYRQPWSGDLGLMWEHSPASRAATITTPTLVMHGLDDEPVDPRQSVELFSYLQLNGVPSRLVLYPGEGHGINRPSHMLDYITREVQWFRHYLLGDNDAAGAEPPVPVEETVRPGD
jgi:dipeptidyl aminopeptidase/acylaminoacyl peptidase